MSIDVLAIRARLGTLQNQTTKENLLWKPPAGNSVIRIVPYKFNKNNPFIELLFHYGLAGKNYLSPVTFGRPDPIIEFSEKLRSTGNKDEYKLSKTLEPKLRTFAPIIVRGKESEGTKFWGFGKTVYQQLLEVIADPDYGDITDAANGRDIAITFKTAEETKKDYPQTTILVKPNKTRITEDAEVLKKIVDSQKQITEIYKELTYDELKVVLEAWLKDPNPKQKTKSDGERTEQKPKQATVVTSAVDLDEKMKEFDTLFNQ